MTYKMAFAARSPSGSLVQRDTDAFFFCRPLPTRASGILLPFIFSPRLSLRLRSLALRSLPAYVKCAFACYRRELAISVQRERKEGGS